MKIVMKIVRESISFQRGALNTREDTLDRILNRKINIELNAANVSIDKNGIVSKGIDEDNDYFLEIIEKSGAEWQQLAKKYDHGAIPFEFRGTKEQLLPIIGMWDAYSRDQSELEKALEDWDGEEKSLWDIIG